MKSVAAILVGFCLVHLQDVDATVSVLRKSLVPPIDKKLGFWVESYTDEHLTYALCDSKHLQDDDVKCTVIREKKPYGNDSYSCDVTLKRPHVRHDPERLPRISVYPFGQKYAALTVWEEDKYLNFTIVQMDSCKVSEAGIHTGTPLDRKSVAFVGHSDSFDVFFEDVAAIPCGDKACKATINADGNVINEPKPSIKKYVTSAVELFRPIVALENDSAKTGLFYITADEKKNYTHVLLKADGTEKTLALTEQLGFVAVSTKNNLLGVCQTDSKVECSQYDFDGNLKLRRTVVNGDELRVYIYIYNLPTGGFYGFGADCQKNSKGTCIEVNYYLIERIDANGTKSGSIVFQGFDDPIGLMIALFYENDAKEVCFSLASTLPDGSRSELFANCFTDADFSN